METSDVPFGSQRSVQGGTLVKKPVLFVIAIVFALSVVVINFFGLALRNDQFKNYVQKVEIESELIEKFPDGQGGEKKWIIFKMKEGELTDTFMLDYKCYPFNADDTNVRYTVVDANSGKVCKPDTDEDGRYTVNNTVIINPNGEVVIFKNAIGHTYRITVTTVDGSNVSDNVNLFVQKP